MILNVNEATETDPPVSISMTLEQAEWLRDQVSDILCWVNGFNAATPDIDHGPMGQTGLRELNIALKNSIHEKLQEIRN